MYIIMRNSDQYLVVNKDTQEIQSAWYNYTEAYEVMKRLNRLK